MSVVMTGKHKDQPLSYKLPTLGSDEFYRRVRQLKHVASVRLTETRLEVTPAVKTVNRKIDLDRKITAIQFELMTRRAPKESTKSRLLKKRTALYFRLPADDDLVQEFHRQVCSLDFVSHVSFAGNELVITPHLDCFPTAEAKAAAVNDLRQEIKSIQQQLRASIDA